jgi:hypothetical protein
LNPHFHFFEALLSGGQCSQKLVCLGKNAASAKTLQEGLCLLGTVKIPKLSTV